MILLDYMIIYDYLWLFIDYMIIYYYVIILHNYISIPNVEIETFLSSKHIRTLYQKF